MTPAAVESALQVRVREAIVHLGGFWRPANAAIRLLEELGEIAEHALDPLLGPADLAGECADLWIISTALADQFYAHVAEPRPPAGDPVDGPQQLAELLAAGGRIGRIVNYYDGPKNPRTLDGWLSLEQAVAALHGHLSAFAATHAVDLRAAIEATLERNVATDAGRFAPTYDARTAPVLGRFATVRATADYPWPGESRLFGAPDWIDGDPGRNVDAMAAALRSFLRAAGPERLDGFVIGGPGLATSEEIDAWAAEVIRATGVGAAPVRSTTFSPFASSAPGVRPPNEPFLVLRPAT